MARVKRPPPVATMDPWQVVRRPHVSEKSHDGVQHRNVYTLEVDPRATKTDIREAVSRIWGVQVLGVRTISVLGKAKRMGRKAGRAQDWKKAMVHIAEGQGIEAMR